MSKPAQIIVIPQNLLSKQSINILKQRQVLPSNASKLILPHSPQYKPMATVAPVMSVSPVMHTFSTATTSPITTQAVKQRQVIFSSPQQQLKVKRSLSPTYSVTSNDSEENEDDYTPARKRANLDHLSAEEKLQRRKLKNRVAAQTARDKKKAYIDEVELDLAKIKEKLRQVEKERDRLKTDNTQLIERNLALEKRLGIDILNSETPSHILPNIDSSYILPLSPESLPARSPSPAGSYLSSCSTADQQLLSPTSTTFTSNMSNSIVMMDDSLEDSSDLPEPAALMTPLPQETRRDPLSYHASQKMLPVTSTFKTLPPACTALSSHDLTTLSPNFVKKEMDVEASPTIIPTTQQRLLLLLTAAISCLLLPPPPPKPTSPSLEKAKKIPSSSIWKESMCSPKTSSTTQPGKPPPTANNNLLVPLKKRDLRSPLQPLPLIQQQ